MVDFRHCYYVCVNFWLQDFTVVRNKIIKEITVLLISSYLPTWDKLHLLLLF